MIDKMDDGLPPVCEEEEVSHVKHGDTIILDVDKTIDYFNKFEYGVSFSNTITNLVNARLDIFSKQVNHVKWIIKNNKLKRFDNGR